MATAAAASAPALHTLELYLDYVCPVCKFFLVKFVFAGWFCGVVLGWWVESLYLSSFPNPQISNSIVVVGLHGSG